jgi:hypothetical protein
MADRSCEGSAQEPEVRKAGGVYYTPKYIVDYIVKNTVGKIIEGKSPRQIEKIKILGLINSRLLNFYYLTYLKSTKKVFSEIQARQIEQLPIRTIDFNNSSEKAIHDKLVSFVNRMLELHQKKAALPPSAEREKIEREITITDEKIDEMVYGLYGVTEEERKIIEG